MQHRGVILPSLYPIVLKTKTRQLAKLLKNACCSTNITTLKEQQVLALIQQLKQQITASGLRYEKPVTAFKNAHSVWRYVVTALYAIQKTGVGISPSCLSELENLSAQVSRQMQVYYYPGITNNDVSLLRLDACKTSLQKAKEHILLFTATQQQYAIINRHIDMAMSGEPASPFAWVWWSYFCHYIKSGSPGCDGTLSSLLTGLNFNCPEYLHSVYTAVKDQLLTLNGKEEKIDFLTTELAKYELQRHLSPVGYHPLAKPVHKAVIGFLKSERKVLTMQNTLPVFSHQPAAETGKIETTLSVPQLALFARLLIDANIIKTGNQAALLKQVAAAFSARGTTMVSSKSLRVNYYDPATPATNILKDHLINMLNQLKKY